MSISTLTIESKAQPPLKAYFVKLLQKIHRSLEQIVSINHLTLSGHHFQVNDIDDYILIGVDQTPKELHARPSEPVVEHSTCRLLFQPIYRLGIGEKHQVKVGVVGLHLFAEARQKGRRQVHAQRLNARRTLGQLVVELGQLAEYELVKELVIEGGDDAVQLADLRILDFIIVYF